MLPLDDGDFESLLRAVERLALNDAAIKWEREQSLALGMGLRMGFLGVLHMEVRRGTSSEWRWTCLAIFVTKPLASVERTFF